MNHNLDQQCHDTNGYGQAHRPSGPLPFAFEHSSFSIDGRPDLTLVVHNPATSADDEKSRFAVEAALAQGI